MDEILKAKLSNVLRCEGDYILNSDIDMLEKVKKMDDIMNLQKIIICYDELKPVLKEFFNKRAYDKRWCKNENKER